MHTTNFKHQLETRVDRKVKRDAEKEATWRACCKAVDARDHRICRCCGRKTNPDDVGLKRGHRHHIVYRSAGGPDTSANVLTLCFSCHNDEHKGRLDIRPNDSVAGADGQLTFWRWDADGMWYLSKREVDVHRIEKD
jgi:5-methylcytosine-specific restriction endonuclease McrA